MQPSRLPVGSRAGRFVALALAMLGLGFLVFASTRAPTESAPPSTVGQASLRAFLDPESGTLTTGPAPAAKADDAALQAMLSRSTDGLQEVVHPDGSVSVNLQGRFQSAAVARIGANGKLATSCVEQASQAQAFLKGPAPAPTQPTLEVQ